MRVKDEESRIKDRDTEKVDKGNKDSEEVEQEEDNVNDNNKVKEEEK